MAMDVTLIGVIPGTSGTKEVPQGPMTILAQSIHFRSESTLLSDFWEKLKSLYGTYFFSFGSCFTFCLPKAQREIPNVLNELISEVPSSFKILQHCGS